MSNTYGAQTPFGGSLTDLVSTQKGGVQNVSKIAQSLTNAFPPATASTSPNPTGVQITSATTTLVAANPNRHGILFHVPSIGSSITTIVWPSTLATTPTLSMAAGALTIGVGSTVTLPSTQFPNVNCAWVGMAGTTSGTWGFTVWEFY